MEEKLRQLGFGYRAKYIAQTAKQILQKEGEEQWLWNLRKTSYAEAKAALVELAGVGPKVADCVVCVSLYVYLYTCVMCLIIVLKTNTSV